MLPVRVSELARGGESCLASSGAAANRSLLQLTASHCCVRGGRSSECTTIGDPPTRTLRERESEPAESRAVCTAYCVCASGGVSPPTDRVDLRARCVLGRLAPLCGKGREGLHA